MSTYDDDFYARQAGGSVRSAGVVVPYVVSLLSPRSVIDMGCGVGTWLNVFLEHGVETILGVDGDYVPRQALLIPLDRFAVRDLTKPVGIADRFDLAVSLEVAEHLPPEAASHFVDELVALSDVVLFSAAIPGQGGVEHVNEQWQSYWRDLFEERGYSPVDCIRARFWLEPSIAAYYRQNIILYAKRTALEGRPELKREAERTSVVPFNIVHPDVFTWNLKAQGHHSLGNIVRRLPGAVMDSVKRRLGRRATA
jgi:hypothetical protein